MNEVTPTGKSVSVSVRVVRAGEAKLRGRARGIQPPVAKARADQMNLARRPVRAGVPAVSRGVCVPARAAAGCPDGVPRCPV